MKHGKSLRTGATMAMAAAAYFATVPIQASDSTDKVRCHGVNTCKGRGACATANNQCAGQNSCKGQGVLEMSRGACESAGGSAET